MSVAACPACIAAPDAAEATKGAVAETISFALPGIHCAACISAVERGLIAVPGVRSARVNLSLRRVRVEAVREGMSDTLREALARIGYEAHPLDATTMARDTDPKGRALLMRLGVAGFAMMNVMLLSVAVWSGAEGITRDLFHWVSAFIALPATVYAATPFFESAWSALRVRRLNMDVPISLAILLAGGMSLSETIMGGENAYFDAALSLTFFLLAGRFLDHRTRAAARSASLELAALDVARAERGGPGGWTSCEVAALVPGDIVRILPGARVPADGEVVKGGSEIDQSLLTGEPVPVAVGPGAALNAGVTNLTGPLEMRVSGTGDETLLGRMRELVSAAEATKNRYTSLADRAARVYAPVVHLLALAAFLFWYWWGGDLRHALNVAVAVLIITCPCALGLAVPAVMTAANGRLFRSGVLVKDATALERLAEIDRVVFDKTGTLTSGRPVLVSDHAPERLALAAALAGGSSHPLARAIADAAAGLLPEVEGLREHPGQGIEASWQGREVRLGRAEWVGADPVDGMATFLSVDGATEAFRFTDAALPAAAATVARFEAEGFPVTILSGDAPASVADFAREIGAHDALGGIRPEEKLDRIRSLEGHALMVGDGLNDAAALAGAHVSASPAKASDVARTAADILLIRNDLSVLPGAVGIARSARRRVLENFTVAALYNAIAVPIALLGFASPLMAALAMSTSSILVSLNALRLGKVR